MIIIPDIHGRSFWKDAVKGHEEEKIIFLGDYTDPYPHEGIEQSEGLKCLCEVIEFKKQHKENVVLLLGNHDLSYVSNHLAKCRHDYENHDVIKKLISDNLSLFNVVHEETVGCKRVVFSHAGIIPKWLKNNEEVLGHIPYGKEVSVLNKLFHDGSLYMTLGAVSWYRGGKSDVGSCVWADIDEHIDILATPLPYCYQVFGHTHRVIAIITKNFACLDCSAAFTLDDDFNFTEIYC